MLLKDEWLGKGKDHIKVILKINRIQASIKIITGGKRSENNPKVLKRPQLRMVRLPDLDSGSPDAESPLSVQTVAEL